MASQSKSKAGAGVKATAVQGKESFITRCFGKIKGFFSGPKEETPVKKVASTPKATSRTPKKGRKKRK